MLFLVLPGERALDELPLEARDMTILLGYVGVPGELLGGGGAALLDGEALQVLQRRAAAMALEISPLCW